jgi:hypothetical protein
VARCPECEGSHLTRISTEVESRYDGVREWAVQTGARYGCNDCSTVIIVRPDGVRRLKPKLAPPAQVGNEKPKAPPGTPAEIPVRLAGGRTLGRP